jgi:predicted ester cyclase
MAPPMAALARRPKSWDCLTRTVPVTKAALLAFYQGYIACLNRQDWPNLARFVGEDVCHNGRHLGVAGYREMLQRDYRDIPDLAFAIELMVADPPHIAVRLVFDCTPKGRFLGLAVDGRRVRFCENVIYRLRDDKIEHVWSIIDKAAIEAQL